MVNENKRPGPEMRYPVRRLLRLPDELDAGLRLLAARRKVSVADLIREHLWAAIGEALAYPVKPTQKPRPRGANQPFRDVMRGAWERS